MVRPLRVGVQLPEVEREVPWPEYAAMARAAEEVGFDSVWMGDHLLYREDGRPERGPWDAWMVLAGIAAITERVRLGPLVACTAFHLPGLLARKAAALAEISDGRLVLGLGAGWNESEFRAFGIPFDHRASRFGESFEIVRRLLAGERVTFSGRFHRVEEAVLLPPPAGRPTLMIGSTGERVLSLALPHADVWNTWYDWYGNTAEGFARANGRIDDLLERVGRRRQAVARSACALVAVDPGASDRSLDETLPLQGSAERIAAGLRELAEAGADEAILVLAPITERSIRDLGEVVAILDA
jgi:alkanesulfonate monooxygenase SsuD/methylene tetrahydromethanopterin reductase-like flavin-dependent oxidoreductase (luciferase family)